MEFDLNRDIDWQLVWEWAFKIGAALLILLVTHFVARAVKWAIARLVDRIPPLQRHSSAQPGETVGSQLGTLAYWLVWLVGLLLALQPLELSQVLTPVRQLTDETFGYLPNIIASGVIFFIGYVFAGVIRRIIETALLAANVDGWLSRAGVGDVVGPEAGEATASSTKVTLSRTVATIASAIVLIVFAIAALQVLGISSISNPAENMLAMILAAIPRVIAAAIWLAIAYLIGRWAKSLVEQTLPSLGFDSAAKSIGIIPESSSPSRVVGNIVLVAVMLFAAIEAARQLGGTAIAGLLVEVTQLGGRVIFGLAIIAIGLLLARLLGSIVASTTGESKMLQTLVRWLVVAVFVAMGLSFMEIADEIVVIAFGSIVISAAVAAAIAFGLGGRPTAHKLLERWTGGGASKTNPGDTTPPGL